MWYYMLCRENIALFLQYNLSKTLFHSGRIFRYNPNQSPLLTDERGGPGQWGGLSKAWRQVAQDEDPGPLDPRQGRLLACSAGSGCCWDVHRSSRRSLSKHPSSWFLTFPSGLTVREKHFLWKTWASAASPPASFPRESQKLGSRDDS